MQHREVIVTKNNALYDLFSERLIEEKIEETFTFNVYRNSGKDYNALLTFVMFQNFKYMGDIRDGSISLGKSYLIEIYQFDINPNFDKVKIQLTNDFGKQKFYPLAAFRFVNTETERVKFW